MRVNRPWLNFHFWVNYPLNAETKFHCTLYMWPIKYLYLYIIPTLANKTVGKETGAFALSVSGNAMTYFKAHESEEKICYWLILCSLFGSRKLLYFRWFQYFLYGRTGIVITVVCFIHSFPEQMLMLNRILTTLWSTAFVHKKRYSQHKMKVPQRGFNNKY